MTETKTRTRPTPVRDERAEERLDRVVERLGKISALLENRNEVARESRRTMRRDVAVGAFMALMLFGVVGWVVPVLLWLFVLAPFLSGAMGRP